MATGLASRQLDHNILLLRRPPAALNNRARKLLLLARCSKHGAADTAGAASMGEVTSYRDSWLDKQLITAFTKALCAVSGKSTELPNYDGFTHVTTQVSQTRSPEQQREISGTVLRSLIPLWLRNIIRTLLPPSRFTAEFFALSTALFSSWLIGSSKVIEVEVNGVRQRSGVRVTKCRFLENSNCVGSCVNMCKMPSQKFIGEELGTPLTMIPNFEDMSCEFIYGQVPPPLEQDPASQQPCYHALCPTAKKSKQVASRLCPKA